MHFHLKRIGSHLASHDRTILIMTSLAFFVFMSACAGPSATKSTTVVASYIEGVRVQGEAFTKFRDKLAKDRTRLSDLQENQTIAREGKNAAQLVRWKVIDGKNIGPERTLYQATLDASEDVAKRRKEALERQNQQRAALSKVKSQVKLRSDKLSEAAKTLAQLAEEPNLKQRLEFYISFFTDVNKEIQKSRNAAEGNATAAATAIKSKETESVNEQLNVP